MNFLYIPLFIICVAAGGLAYCVITGVPLALIASNVQTRLSPVLNTWNTLPPAVQGILIAGVPTLFMVFFAWTKTRAMQQLKTTQVQAGEQIQQLSGKAYEAEEQVGIISKQRDSLQQKYDTLAASNDDVTALSGKLTQSKENLDRLQRDYNTMERTLQNTINDLKQKVVTVVK